jgi:hypothetical protein
MAVERVRREEEDSKKRTEWAVSKLEELQTFVGAVESLKAIGERELKRKRETEREEEARRVRQEVARKKKEEVQKKLAQRK